MTLGIKPADIKDETLRVTMERASQALDGGANRDCVDACAEAYLSVLKHYPKITSALETVMSNERVKAGLERGMIRNAPLMWPRYGAKLDLSGDEPSINVERTPAFAEAIQYYEFTLDVIVKAESGEEIEVGAIGGGFG